jgi:hypothetical protein
MTCRRKLPHMRWRARSAAQRLCAATTGADVPAASCSRGHCREQSSHFRAFFEGLASHTPATWREEPHRRAAICRGGRIDRLDVLAAELVAAGRHYLRAADAGVARL